MHTPHYIYTCQQRCETRAETFHDGRGVAPLPLTPCQGPAARGRGNKGDLRTYSTRDSRKRERERERERGEVQITIIRDNLAWALLLMALLKVGAVVVVVVDWHCYLLSVVELAYSYAKKLRRKKDRLVSLSVHPRPTVPSSPFLDADLPPPHKTPIPCFAVWPFHPPRYNQTRPASLSSTSHPIPSHPPPSSAKELVHLQCRY